MNNIVQHTQIFGPVSSFAECLSCDTLQIERFEHYQKRSFRNRYQIQTTNGLVTLSIPLTKGKNNQQLITDVRISYDENWPFKQLQCIRSAYGKSPFFEHYFPDIEKIFSKKSNFLFDLNLDTINWAVSKLKLPTVIKFTEEFVRKELHNNKYLPLSIDHTNPSSFFSLDDIKYTQVWEDKFDFMPNLSILDLLFCQGPEAKLILNKMKFNSSK